MCEFHAKAEFIARLVVHHRLFVGTRVKLCATHYRPTFIHSFAKY